MSGARLSDRISGLRGKRCEEGTPPSDLIDVLFECSAFLSLNNELASTQERTTASERKKRKYGIQAWEAQQLQ